LASRVSSIHIDEKIPVEPPLPGGFGENPFREEVEAASDVALVPRSFRFARRIERRLAERGIRYRREDLLYPVLFGFSEEVSLSWLVP
jgi:hypothetical protein